MPEVRALEKVAFQLRIFLNADSLVKTLGGREVDPFLAGLYSGLCHDGHTQDVVVRVDLFEALGEGARLHGVIARRLCPRRPHPARGLRAARRARH